MTDVLTPEDIVEEWSDLSASSLGPGARLGRYELLLPIAYGGMARVWAARMTGQRGFSKLVAIKTILPHLAHNPEFEKMFLDEARIAAGVHHPNVCEIYELGEEGHVLYLAMEWVNGDSLVHILRPGGKTALALEARIAARIVADACAGLHAAHELTDDFGTLLNVVHRDVSPHNILVSLEGTVKVADFGVAKAREQTHQATTAGQIKGKVAYMGPEQIAGSGIDRRSDVFAMGCVLYEATTGQQAFKGGNDPQIMQSILRGAYEPPVRLVRGFPVELAAIIDRALSAEPRARFATAERMRVALEEWLAKSGPVVTATQVGSVVRQRLGAMLEKRRDHVRAAMNSLTGDPPPAIGHTPSGAGVKGPSAQSRSGVVIAPAPAAGGMAPPSSDPRARMPSQPLGLPAPPPAATPMAPAVTADPIAPLPPPRPPMATHPSLARVETQAPTMTRYVVAAVAGVLFALLVVAVVLGAVAYMRPAATQPAPTAAAISARPPTSSTPPSTPSVAPGEGPRNNNTSTTPAPSSIDVTSLPTAKPAWQTAPPPPGSFPPAPPPAPTTKRAIPANPY